MTKWRTKLIILGLAAIFVLSSTTPLFSAVISEAPQQGEEEIVITSNTFVKIAEKAKHFVVTIIVSKKGILGIIRQSIGSGIIIDKEGHILTNNHVIEKAKKVVVKIDGKTYEAQIIGRDPATDLALIKIKPEGKISPAPLGDSDKIKVGQWVAAVGSPFGLSHTVTCGIISGKERRLRLNFFVEFIQTSAQINPGNSGGPLVNLKGEVIGINTVIFSSRGMWAGVGFAIPINTARAVLPTLKQYGKIVRGWFGITTVNIESLSELDKQLLKKGKKISQIPSRGILIIEVASGSPADKAKIKKGDIICKFNGQDVKSERDLFEMITKTKPDSVVEIKIRRGKKEIIINVKIEERKQ